jgi:hypothetical protein
MTFKTSVKLVLLTALFALFPGLGAHAQYPVTDAGAIGLLTQGNANFLQQMASDLAKLDTQITHLQNIETQGQQTLTDEQFALQVDRINCQLGRWDAESREHRRRHLPGHPHRHPERHARHP